MVRIILPGQNAPDYPLPSGVTIYCTKYSGVDSWAQQNGYPIIYLDNVLVLPEALLTIEAEAFSSTDASIIVVPEGCTTIGRRAFSNYTSALAVYLPDSVTHIADDAFEGCGNISFICPSQNIAVEYAAVHNIPCIISE